MKVGHMDQGMGEGSLIQLEREGSQIFIKCNGESSRMKGTKRRSLGPVGTSQLYQMKKIGPDKEETVS